MNILARFFSITILFMGFHTYAQDTLSFSSGLSPKQLREAPAKLIPFPQEVDWDGKFIPVEGIRLQSKKNLSPNLLHELREIFSHYNIDLKPEGSLTFKFSTSNVFAEEAYKLVVSTKGIEVEAASETGHFYALQTIRQLIRVKNGRLVIPVCVIRDAPAFPIRGYMIDVGRNFQSLTSLKKQLDIMSRYKLNVFQWHLTDRPAWRIESIRHPELTAAENHRPTRDPGKFYTYDEIRELIRYARERHIRIIPEIDMPGHSDSFIKAMGLKMESERGMEILEEILAEFFEEIPQSDCPIIHIGSDEVHISNPKAFMDRMVDFCERNDRKVMIWNPGLPTKSSVIRQTWRPTHVGSGTFSEIDS